MSVYEDRGRLEEQVRDARMKALLKRAGLVGFGFLAAWWFWGDGR